MRLTVLIFLGCLALIAGQELEHHRERRFIFKKFKKLFLGGFDGLDGLMPKKEPVPETVLIGFVEQPAPVPVGVPVPPPVYPPPPPAYPPPSYPPPAYPSPAYPPPSYAPPPYSPVK